MCGIIALISNEPVADDILAGLRRLEYRGYDSAGIATLEGTELKRVRAEGKLKNLDKALRATELSGHVGIGHTRWATHGAPVETNAHPHMTERVAVVHNGIIENFRELREELTAKGCSFASETDTEVVPVLLTHLMAQGMDAEQAFEAMLARIDGAFSIAALMKDSGHIMVARQGAPLVIGTGSDCIAAGSDALALAGQVDHLIYLEEGDWGILRADGFSLFDAENQPTERESIPSQLSAAQIGKGNYRHYMLKEIHEQPSVIGQTLQSYCRPLHQEVALPPLPVPANEITRLHIIACGTSYYAGMTAAYWLEQWAQIPVSVDIASEFRYREPVLREGNVMLCISQSGETADTLAALHYAKAAGIPTMSIVNVTTSSMARASDVVLPTYAGPEIGVASTKAFTAQLTVLACLALGLAEQRGTLSTEEREARLRDLQEIPALCNQILQQEHDLQQLAHDLAHVNHMLYLGRGLTYPIAMEGALKLKEISYIHAEGYAAGELKHGPIALIDDDMPVVVLAPQDRWQEKTLSNMHEVLARGGQIVLISDDSQTKKLRNDVSYAMHVPSAHPDLAPLLYSIPVQLLAYHTAVAKGTDVDQPRNLAKSVTVE